MIYLILRGRIGNQLFMYAFANSLRRNKNELIIIDDAEVLEMGWENSLVNYNLPNVKYVHQRQYFSAFFPTLLIDKFHRKKIYKMPYMEKYNYESSKKNMYQRIGYMACENGYMHFDRCTKNVLLDGYFQSEKYFVYSRNDIKKQYNLNNNILLQKYPGISDIRNRNSVCISIKVEHNVGSALYDVCTKEYWEKAINRMIEKVDNPLFFICSDNVDYVKNNLIDCDKFDVIEQDRKSPVHVSLAAMSQCKHFITGNTTFGWWAQYLSENDSKIVIAPSKWMKVEMPIDIYQSNWTLIDV